MHQINMWMDLAGIVAGLDIVAMSLGPSGEAYVLAVDTPPSIRSLAYRSILLDLPHDYVVFRLDDGKVTRFDIRHRHLTYHYVQPLTENEWLLVCSRELRHESGIVEKNGHIFAQDGKLQRQLSLGDGIQDIQATRDGRLWASYFDEGIYRGNDPVGQSGLVQWDSEGNRLYTFSPCGWLDYMDDCYAINVPSSEDIWCCYYSQFPLVHIQNHEIVGMWRCPIAGSHAFALDGDRVLFQGGYRDAHYEYYLMTVDADDTMNEIAKLQLADEQGVRIRANRVAARGSIMLLLRGTDLYRLDVKNLA